MKTVLCQLLTVLLWASIAGSLPPPAKQNALLGSFAGEASQLIATQLLKHNKDIDANQVYSPLGTAALLAILAEASEGDTYAEFVQVLGFPKQRSDLRKAFKSVLGNSQNLAAGEAFPLSWTMFYAYRNYTVREDYRRLLQQHYNVLVKDIYPSEDIPHQLQDAYTEGGETNNSKDVIDFETLKRSNLNVDAVIGPSDNYDEELLGKEASKLDSDVDDKQYVEKPVALAEAGRLQQLQLQEQSTTEESATATPTATESPTSNDAPAEKLENPAEIVPSAEPENVVVKQQTKRSGTEENLNVEENETVLEDEKLDKLQGELSDASEPAKVRIPLQKMKNAVKSMVQSGADEIMIALESHLRAVERFYGTRTLFGQDDIASALTTNTITGRAIGSQAKVVLINGLYHRGSWAQPFYQLRNGRDEFFFMTNEDAMKATMMHTRGKFHVADLPHLKARLLSLPYANPKYGLIIVLPNDPEGLSEVIAKLEPSDYKYACENAQLKELHVTLPRFQVEEITHSRAMLLQLGLERLFSRTEAQLGNLSPDADLHVEDIAQFVNVRVDEGGSRARAWALPQLKSRSVLDDDANPALPVSEPEPEPEPEPGVERFDVNHPFAYFMMDFEHQFVLASGKVYDPEFKEFEATLATELK